MISIRSAAPDDYPAYAILFRELLIDDPIADRAIWTEQCRSRGVAASHASRRRRCIPQAQRRRIAVGRGDPLGCRLGEHRPPLIPGIARLRLTATMTLLTNGPSA